VAEVNAHKVLRNGKVAAAIALATQARSERTAITQDHVLHEIALLQHSTIEHYQIDDTGNLVLAPGAPADAMRAISGLKKKIIHTESGVIYETEFRLWNKPASLRMGGQHLGLFKEQVEVSGSVKVVRLPEKAPSVDAWSERQYGPGRGTDLGTPAEAN
jgi:phage terminase small subunit